jgi:prepilin peptidase CpaA
MVSPPPELGLFLVGLVGVAVVLDVRFGRIPNSLLLAIAGLGLTARLALAGPTDGLVAGLAGLAVGLAIWIGPFALRWVGAADVKLVAAVGAWLGPLATFRVSLAAGLAGGLMGLAYLLATRRRVATEALETMQVQLLQLRVMKRFSPGTMTAVRERGMPYAIAILAGLLAELILRGQL